MIKKMNLKKLSALFLALVMVLGLVTLAPMTTAIAASGNSIFSADFNQEPYPEFVSMKTDGGKPSFSVVDNTGYIHDDPGWTYGAFVFDDSMASGEYEISFDFNLVDYYRDADCGIGFLTDDYIYGASSASPVDEFRMISIQSGSLCVGGTSVGVQYADNKWFSYKMTVDKAQSTWSVTVTEKDNVTNTATATGTNFPTKSISRMMFGTACEIYIDNISVTKLAVAPYVVSVKYTDNDAKIQSLPGITTSGVAVTFSDKMDLDSLKAAVTYKGADNVNIAGDGELSTDGMTYTFPISQKLNAGGEYTLSVLKTAKSSQNAEMAANYTLTETASDGVIIFNANFNQEPYPEFVSMKTDGGKPSFSVVDNMGYIHDDPGWTYGAFVFDDSMASGEYEISFDFNLVDYYRDADYGIGFLTDDYIYGDSSTSPVDEFRMISIQSGSLCVGGTSVGVQYADNKWFSYKMTVDKAQSTWSVTVTEKDNVTNTATATGTNFPTKSISRMMFGTACEIYIDNISIKRVIKSVAVTGVEYLDTLGNTMSSLNASVAAIKIFFSEQMYKNSLASAVTLKNSDDESVAVGEGELSADKMSYTLPITDILEADGTYTLKVSSSATSVFGLNTEPYEKTLKVSDGNTLLNVDYDTETKALELWTGAPTVTYETDSITGNKYMSIDPGWKNSGYSFDRSIPKNGGQYTVKFDFMNYKRNSDYFAIALTQKDCLDDEGEKSVYDVFGLLAMTSSGGIEVAGQTFTGLEYKSDVWYSYDLTFNRTTGNYQLTIAEKGNADNKVQGSGTFSKTETWGHGMYDNRVYDAIKFYCDNPISIDNIVIKQADKTPSLSDSSISFVTKSGSEKTDINNVSINTEKIVIDFNDIVNMRTVASKISLVSAKDSNPINHTVSQDGTKLILTLSDELQAEKKYTLSIAAGIKTLSDAIVSGKREFTLTAEDNGFALTLSNVKIGGVEVENYSQWSATDAEINFSAKNTTGDAKSANIIIGYFAASGELLDIQCIDIEVAHKADGDATKTATLKKPTGSVSAKVMCWTSLEMAKPLSKALDINKGNN